MSTPRPGRLPLAGCHHSTLSARHEARPLACSRYGASPWGVAARPLRSGLAYVCHGRLTDPQAPRGSSARAARRSRGLRTGWSVWVVLGVYVSGTRGETGLNGEQAGKTAAPAWNGRYFFDPTRSAVTTSAPARGTKCLCRCILHEGLYLPASRPSTGGHRH